MTDEKLTELDVITKPSNNDIIYLRDLVVKRRV